MKLKSMKSLNKKLVFQLKSRTEPTYLLAEPIVKLQLKAATCDQFESFSGLGFGGLGFKVKGLGCKCKV